MQRRRQNRKTGGREKMKGGRPILWRAREREPIWGSRDFVLSGVQGQSPWSGGRSPPEADDILTFETLNLTLF